MKVFGLLMALFFLFSCSIPPGREEEKENEKSPVWTWVSGSDTPDQKGTYGTKGTPDASNVPGARGNYLMSWIDESGNLWLFGGNSRTGSDEGALNDLWKMTMEERE